MSKIPTGVPNRSRLSAAKIHPAIIRTKNVLITVQIMPHTKIMADLAVMLSIHKKLHQSYRHGALGMPNFFPQPFVYPFIKMQTSK